MLACLGYLASGVLTSRLKRNEIGPVEQIPSTAGWREMSEGFNLLKDHGDALRGILATAFQRGGLTALTLMGLLLERNHYHSPNNPDAGLRGFAIALGIAGVGVGLGSIVSPFGVMKMGRHRWIRLMMVGAVPALLLFAFSTKEIFLIVAAFFVGLCGQAVKVTNDALVQSKIEDEYRGRVFAFYDVAVNGAIVLGAIVAAFVLPKSGNSALLPLLITALYIWVASFLLRPKHFSAR